MNMLLAQSTSLDGAMSEGLGIIAKFLFIVAVIVIAHGGWQARSGNADMAKMSIVGGLLLVSQSSSPRPSLTRAECRRSKSPREQIDSPDPCRG